MKNLFGPWTTAIHADSNPQLGTFWKKRMRMLPLLTRASRKTSLQQYFGASLVAALLLGLPLIHGRGAPHSAPAQQEPPKPAATLESAQLRKAREALQKVYALKDGEVLKCILPPFPPERDEYVHLLQRDDRLVEMLRMQSWEWDGDLLHAGVSTYPGGGLDAPLINAILAVTGVRLCEMEGGQIQLLDKLIHADFVVRKAAAKVELVAQLSKILQHDFDLPLKLSYRQVDRDVLVVKGSFRAKQGVGSLQENPIRIFGKRLPDMSQKGSFTASGSFGDMFDRLGAYVGQQVFTEIKPNIPVVWYQWQGDRGQEGVETKAVLDKFTQQTGLTFKPEKRRVHVLFVEREER